MIIRMEQIKKKYIVDERQQTVAVQIDIADFEKIEQLLEDYALGKILEKNDPSDNLTLADAKAYYDQISKTAK